MYDLQKFFCFKSNDYNTENHGLKWTENLRSVQFKFTKKLNFCSVQVLFGKSELSSVQSSPKNELLNWTELFRSVRPIHWFFLFKWDLYIIICLLSVQLGISMETYIFSKYSKQLFLLMWKTSLTRFFFSTNAILHYIS